MFTFHRIGWEDNSEHSGWWLYISTEEELHAYFQYQAYDLAQVWYDIKDSPDVWGHCKTQKANVMKAILNLKMEEESRSSIPMPEAVNFLEHTFTNTKIRIFHEEGALYANSCGGCHGPHLRNDHRGVDEHIYEVHENKDLVFPTIAEDIVTITRWPMSPHFYLSVNGRHVDVDGVEKWNTIEAAEDAKEVCLRRLRRKKKNE